MVCYVPVASFASHLSGYSGSYGRRLLEDIEKKLDQMAAPPPSKIIKALPVPEENSKKKRGGRRYVLQSCFPDRSQLIYDFCIERVRLRKRMRRPNCENCRTVYALEKKKRRTRLSIRPRVSA
jgi:hypothetical protein